MTAQYGPALVVGMLIGGAILLDDVIAPPELRFHPPLTIHEGEPLAAGHHGVWIGQPGNAPLHTEHRDPQAVNNAIRLHLSADRPAEDAATVIELELDSEGDGDQPPHEAIMSAVDQALRQAQVEGRKPSSEDIQSALKAAGVEQTHMDVRVVIVDED